MIVGTLQVSVLTAAAMVCALLFSGTPVWLALLSYPLTGSLMLVALAMRAGFDEYF